MLRSSACALGLLAAASALPAAAAGAPPDLAIHRAVYDLSLDPSAENENVGDARGRMVFDFSGSRCDGYTTNVRFVTQISDNEGNGRTTDVSSSTFEDSDGKTFSFITRTFIDGALAEDTTGSAARDDKRVTVTLSKPAQKRFSLPRSFLFPQQHLGRILEAAERGERFLQIDLFDGSEKGEKSYSTSAVIGPVNAGADDLGDEAAAREAGIAGTRHWPITLSYFDVAPEGEQKPTYQLSFILYEDGVTRRMRLDYGQFALVGKLVSLQMKPVAKNAKACK